MTLRPWLATLIVIGLVLPKSGSSMSSEFGSLPSLGWNSQAKMIQSQIERSFHLRGGISRYQLRKMILGAMDEANPKKIGLEAEDPSRLAKEIIRSSRCYGVDPVVVTALIWRESNFKPAARSERGAVGLTQMTNPGIREVLDRLSPDSPRRLGYLRQLVSRCHPSISVRVGEGEVTPLQLFDWKESIQKNPAEAVAFGVLLLKINLASTRPRVIFGESAFDHYRGALERYNGDPVIKDQFAKDVMLLARRMWEPPTVALNESKFLRLIRGL